MLVITNACMDVISLGSYYLTRVAILDFRAYKLKKVPPAGSSRKDGW